ncbi:MAG TPA: hypothetical protein VH134_18755 [Candidatus Dormibacteraeota bacterium]|nr:hypothetical protein [Candidatus Dormibacteraeota bacterium]
MTESWTADLPAARLLRWTAVLYAVAWAIHTGDHIRRGTGVVTVEVSTLGSIAAVLQLLVVGSVLLRWRWAPLAAAAIGFPDAVGIAAVHLLPHWSAFSDAFPGARGTGVTAFSWCAAILEVTSALLFALAGTHAWRRAQALGAPGSPRSSTGGC